MGAGQRVYTYVSFSSQNITSFIGSKTLQIHLNSPLQFSENHNLVRSDPDYLKPKLTAFSCQVLLQGSRFGKINFSLTKKAIKFNSKTIHDGNSRCGNQKTILIIAGSRFLLLSKIKLFATVFECFQLKIIVTKCSILDVTTRFSLLLQYLAKQLFTWCKQLTSSSI